MGGCGPVCVQIGWCVVFVRCSALGLRVVGQQRRSPSVSFDGVMQEETDVRGKEAGGWKRRKDVTRLLSKVLLSTYLHSC